MFISTLILSLLIPIALGYVVITAIYSLGGGGTTGRVPAGAKEQTAFNRLLERLLEEGLFERFLLGTGLGLGLLTFEMFLLSLFGLPLSVLSVTTAQLVTLIPALYIISRRGSIRGSLPVIEAPQELPTSPRAIGRALKVLITALLLLWVLLKVSFVSYEAFTRPIFSWDTWANWSAGAKLFFYGGGVPTDPGDEYFLGSLYRPFLGHPLHGSLLQTWTALMIGEFHEVYVKGWTLLYYLALLGLIYIAVRGEIRSTTCSMLALLLFASSPILTFHGTDAYSDLPLAYYGFGALFSLWRYLCSVGTPMETGGETGGTSGMMGTGSRGYLFTTGLFAALAILTKNEGMLFLASIIIVLLISLFRDESMTVKGKIKSFFVFLLPLMVLTMPWVLFKVYHGIGYGHGAGDSTIKEISATGAAAIGDGGAKLYLFKELLLRVFLEGNFNILISLWLLLSIISFRAIKGTPVLYLQLMSFLIPAAFILVYFTIEMTAVTDGSGLHRNFLTFYPIIFFTTTVIFMRLWRRW